MASDISGLGVQLDERTVDGRSRITIKRSTNSCGYDVTRIDVPLSTTIKLGEVKHVTVEWSWCRMRLLEKSPLVTGARKTAISLPSASTSASPAVVSGVEERATW